MKRVKTFNAAQQARKAQALKVQFGMMPLLIGGVSGMFVGLIVELIMLPNQLYMQLGGLAGTAFGALVEGVRYGWRKWKQGKPFKSQ